VKPNDLLDFLDFSYSAERQADRRAWEKERDRLLGIIDGDDTETQEPAARPGFLAIDDDR
jgi:hypothetical protein